MNPLFRFETLQTAEAITATIGLQVATWQLPDMEEVVPVHQLLTAAKYGGLVIGAFDGDRMAGFSYGFIGLLDGRPMLCSHMLAVLPQYRGHGLGAALKLEQRRLALQQGLHLMHWTYDPLEAVNASLNVRRLGAIVRRYNENLYGAMSDGLNAGLPSDRFVAEWHLAGRRAQAAGRGESVPAPPIVQARPLNAGPDDLPPEQLELDTAGPLALYIPRSFQAVKKESPELALQWRLRSRASFQRLFAAGYTIVGFDQNAYIFTRDEVVTL